MSAAELKYPQFSLVSTVFNEAKRLEQTISDIEGQTLKPAEIVITDAGSNDGTFEMLIEWARRSITPVIILQKNRCNVAEGRNMAIEAAQYNLIASTDFGCRFHPEWLKSIISPFLDPVVSAVGGAFKVDENEQTTIAAKVDYILADGYKLNLTPGYFIPSSRSIAYKKEVFHKIGGYCEWLTLAGDDMVFGKEIMALGYNIHIVNKPNVSWIRHKTPHAFVKEMFRYGLGNGEAHVDFKNFKLYIAQLALRVIFIIAFLAMFLLKGTIFLIITSIVMMISLWAFLPYWGFFKRWLRYRSSKYDWRVLLYGFWLYERLKIGYIKGYFKGYYGSPDFRKNEALSLSVKLKNVR